MFVDSKGYADALIGHACAFRNNGYCLPGVLIAVSKATHASLQFFFVYETPGVEVVFSHELEL